MELDFVNTLPNLTGLHVPGNQTSAISPLATLTELAELNLGLVRS